VGIAVSSLDRARVLKDIAGCDITGAALESLKAANSVDEIVAALSKRISRRTPNVIPAGAIYLQPTEERRRSGSHYTPRSLTEPIVKTTLQPIFEAMGDRPTPDQILDLKICDPAMGSGHFLVEAVDFITDKTLEFLNAFPWNPVLVHLEQMRKTIQEQMDEQNVEIDANRLTDVNLLKRHVLKRCIYGVDLNPMAVELAKVSLWLDCFTLGAPLSFLDHHLRCGNSLIGSTMAEVDAIRQAKGQLALTGTSDWQGLTQAVQGMIAIGGMPDITADQVAVSKKQVSTR